MKEGIFELPQLFELNPKGGNTCSGGSDFFNTCTKGAGSYNECDNGTKWVPVQ